MRRVSLAYLALAGALLASGAARAGLLEDFEFNDAGGTLLGAAANSANAANLWSAVDTDLTFSSVQGGVFHIEKDNQNPGDSFLQIDNITSGKAWLVVDFTGWSFSSEVGTDDFNSAEPEEIRFAFLDNDTGTSGSTLTAQFQILRVGDGTIQLQGDRAGGGANIANTLALPLSRSTPFSVALEIDEDANEYSVWYKDDLAPYAKLGTEAHDSARNGNSIRFRLNNSFAGTGEFVDIDRVFLTNIAPEGIPEPSCGLLVALGSISLLVTRKRAALALHETGTQALRITAGPHVDRGFLPRMRATN